MDFKGDFDQEKKFEEDLETHIELDDEKDMRASGYIARNDPDAMERYIEYDNTKRIVTQVCKDAGVPVPNAVAIGMIVEILKGMTVFNGEHMLTMSMTAKGLDLTLLRRERQKFDQAA